ncbi:hypothetical protein M569_02417, partial [Genlisea aurea]
SIYSKYIFITNIDQNSSQHFYSFISFTLNQTKKVTNIFNSKCVFFDNLLF